MKKGYPRSGIAFFMNKIYFGFNRLKSIVQKNKIPIMNYASSLIYNQEGILYFPLFDFFAL